MLLVAVLVFLDGSGKSAFAASLEQVRAATQAVGTILTEPRVFYRWGSGTSSRNLIQAGVYTEGLFNYFSRLTDGIVAGTGIYVAGTPTGSTDYCNDSSCRLIEVAIEPGARLIDVTDTNVTNRLSGEFSVHRHDLSNHAGGFGLTLLRYDSSADWFVIRDRAHVRFRAVRMEGWSARSILSLFRTLRPHVQHALARSLDPERVLEVSRQIPLERLSQLHPDDGGILYFLAAKSERQISATIAQLIESAGADQIPHFLANYFDGDLLALPQIRELVIRWLRQNAARVADGGLLYQFINTAFGIVGRDLKAEYLEVLSIDLPGNLLRVLLHRMSQMRMTAEAAEVIRKLSESTRRQWVQNSVPEGPAREWISAAVAERNPTGARTRELIARWESLPLSLEQRVGVVANTSPLLRHLPEVIDRVAQEVIRAPLARERLLNWALEALSSPAAFPQISLGRYTQIVNAEDVARNPRWSEIFNTYSRSSDSPANSIFQELLDPLSADQHVRLGSLDLADVSDEIMYQIMRRTRTSTDQISASLIEWLDARVSTSKRQGDLVAHASRIAQMTMAARRLSPGVSLGQVTDGYHVIMSWYIPGHLRALARQLPEDCFVYLLRTDLGLAGLRGFQETAEALYRWFRLPLLDASSVRSASGRLLERHEQLARDFPLNECTLSNNFQNILRESLTPPEALLLYGTRLDAIRLHLRARGSSSSGRIQLANEARNIQSEVNIILGKLMDQIQPGSADANHWINSGAGRRLLLRAIGASMETADLSRPWLARSTALSSVEENVVMNAIVRSRPDWFPDLVQNASAFSTAHWQAVQQLMSLTSRTLSPHDFSRMSERERIESLARLHDDHLAALQEVLASDPSQVVRDLGAARIAAADARICSRQLSRVRNAYVRAAIFVRRHARIFRAISGILIGTAILQYANNLPPQQTVAPLQAR